MFASNSGEQMIVHAVFYAFLIQVSHLKTGSSIHNIQFGFYALENRKCQKGSLKTEQLYISE